MEPCPSLSFPAMADPLRHLQPRALLPPYCWDWCVSWVQRG